MRDTKQPPREDVALRKLLEGTVSHTGHDFFRALVKNLAETLGTKSAWVTEFIPEQETLKTISFWKDGKFIDDYEFKIPGTPCERVLEEKRLFHIPDNILELYPEDPDLTSDDERAASYLGAPLLNSDGSVLGHLAVLDTRPMPEEARNVDLFKIFADRAASELSRLNIEKRLKERTDELQKEYQRKSEELESARRMQLNMLPQHSPLLPDYEFCFSMDTASEVGGDYYDFLVGDDYSVTFGIGDATGHGLQASVIVTAIKLLFSEHAGNGDIVEFLHKASRSISLMGFKKLFMAFAIGRLKGDTLELAGAGMPAALIYRANDDCLEDIELKGLPLGSRTIYPYTKEITQINPDDVVVLMTDGLPELFNENGEMFGYRQVKDRVMEVAQYSPEKIVDHLKKASASWRNEHSQDDDMTFFVFKRHIK